jgi:hypothetical protein
MVSKERSNTMESGDGMDVSGCVTIEDHNENIRISKGKREIAKWKKIDGGVRRLWLWVVFYLRMNKVSILRK